MRCKINAVRSILSHWSSKRFSNAWKEINFLKDKVEWITNSMAVPNENERLKALKLEIEKQ